MGNNLQRSQQSRWCQQQLAVKFSAPPDCLWQAWVVNLGPVGPDVLLVPEQSSQNKRSVLLLTCCVTVGELQFSVSGLCNVNDVTILISISWESGVTHSRSGTVVAHSSLLGCLAEGQHQRPLRATGKGQSCFSPAVIFTAAFSWQGTFPGGYVPAEPQSSWPSPTQQLLSDLMLASLSPCP